MIEYTNEDVEKLKLHCKEGTVVYEHLMDHGASVEALKELLNMFPKEAEFVFEKPFRELPLEISNPLLQGFLKWRLSIRK